MRDEACPAEGGDLVFGNLSDTASYTYHMLTVPSEDLRELVRLYDAGYSDGTCTRELEILSRMAAVDWARI